MKITFSRAGAALLGAFALTLGLSVPATTASAASEFPAVGEYITSPSGVVLPTGDNAITETILADVVTITPAGLPRFVIIVQITDTSGGAVTISCALINGRVKAASDTHLVFGKISMPAYDSTCTENPSTSGTLEPGQSSMYFAAFNLPPGLGTRVRLTSVFAHNGKLKTYRTAKFNPYGGGTNLEIVAAPPPGLEALADVYEDGYDLTTAIGELLHRNLLPDQPVDIELLAPWDACGDNLACLQKELPTPYLPELQNG